MTHFHLKYFSRAGVGQVNFNAVFNSQMDALSAAGLANATRGKEPGYYGIEECHRATCDRPRPPAGAIGQKRRPAAPGKAVPLPPKMLN